MSSDQGKHRYRIHLSTFLLLTTLASVLLWANFHKGAFRDWNLVNLIGFQSLPDDVYEKSYGWPVLGVIHDQSLTSHIARYSITLPAGTMLVSGAIVCWASFVLNMIIDLMVLILVAGLCEWWISFRARNSFRALN